MDDFNDRFPDTTGPNTIVPEYVNLYADLEVDADTVSSVNLDDLHARRVPLDFDTKGCVSIDQYTLHINLKMLSTFDENALVMIGLVQDEFLGRLSHNKRRTIKNCMTLLHCLPLTTESNIYSVSFFLDASYMNSGFRLVAVV